MKHYSLINQPNKVIHTYGWFQSKWITKLIVLFLIILVYIFLDKTLSTAVINRSSTLLPNLTLDYFATSKGKIHINEIIENVFKKNGYLFVKNDLIPTLKKDTQMNCDEVFYEWQKIADNGLTLIPPTEFPNHEIFLLNYYTKLKSWYINNAPNNEETTLPVWNKTYIDGLINTVKEDVYKLPGSYGNESLSVYFATKYFEVNGKIGAVIGSLMPWAEVHVLTNGAKHVTTIDYQKIKITPPNMSFIYAPDLPNIQKDFNNHFDFVVSYSSIEHSGLGRFGDPLDPIGDIREMNKIHCLLKKDGLLFVGLPVGEDTLYFNAARVYGRMRLAMMFEGFKLLEVFYFDSKNPIKLTKEILEEENVWKQYLFVLQKIG